MGGMPDSARYQAIPLINYLPLFTFVHARRTRSIFGSCTFRVNNPSPHIRRRIPGLSRTCWLTSAKCPLLFRIGVEKRDRKYGQSAFRAQQIIKELVGPSIFGVSRHGKHIKNAIAPFGDRERDIDAIFRLFRPVSGLPDIARRSSRWLSTGIAISRRR